MRAKEFIVETTAGGTTSAGSIATVETGIGTLQTRQQTPKPTKYANSYSSTRLKKKHVSR